MTIVKNIQETVKEYVIQFYDEKVPEEYVYHDIGHIEDVVRVCRQLGVETMYRTTYNTHNNLSALADHKANLMLSINTIMTYCYNIFMFGMIVAVLLFACMFILSGKVQIVGVR